MSDGLSNKAASRAANPATAASPGAITATSRMTLSRSQQIVTGTDPRLKARASKPRSCPPAKMNRCLAGMPSPDVRSGDTQLLTFGVVVLGDDADADSDAELAGDRSAQPGTSVMESVAARKAVHDETARARRSAWMPMTPIRQVAPPRMQSPASTALSLQRALFERLHHDKPITLELHLEALATAAAQKRLELNVGLELGLEVSRPRNRRVGIRIDR